MDTNIIISLLKIIEEDTTIEIKDGYYPNTHPLVRAVIYLSDQILIGDDGHPDRYNIDQVAYGGYSIYPGEMDRYGWLSGCIELKNGIIIFG